MRVRADGTHLATVGSCRGKCFGNDDPAYSPSGRQIAYTKPIGDAPPNGTNGPTQLGVWVMRSDGTGQRKVAQLPGTEDHQPAWAPTETSCSSPASTTPTRQSAHRRSTPSASTDPTAPHHTLVAGRRRRLMVTRRPLDRVPVLPGLLQPHVSQIWIIHPNGSGLRTADPRRTQHRARLVTQRTDGSSTHTSPAPGRRVSPTSTP